MRIVLLGAPGSGKGTQAKLMAESYKVPQISTGEILRAAVAMKSDLGKKIVAVIEAGKLVSDEIVIDAVAERLRSPESRRGFILDGFPRTIPQAQELDTRLGWVSRPLQLALHFALDKNVLVKRTTGRITCGNCGAVYNKYFFPPAKRGTCDHCGAGNLTRRSDDNVKAIRQRLEAYEKDTAPLISYYKAQHKLRTVPADAAPDEIFSYLCEVVDIEIRPLEKKVLPRGGFRTTTVGKVVQIHGGNVAGKVSLGVSGKVSKMPTQKTAAKRATSKKSAAKKAAASPRTTKTPVRKMPTQKTAAKRATSKKSAAKKAAGRKR
jgi:adenylate kinase